MTALGDAVTDELAELNVIAVVGDTPPDARILLSVIVVIVDVPVTVVPGAMFVPLTGIPTPIPIPAPCTVTVVPEVVATLGVTAKGGMT
jgi:hypothetical protein